MSARDTLVTVVGAETLALAQRSGMRVLRRRRDAAAASCERLARAPLAVEVAPRAPTAQGRGLLVARAAEDAALHPPAALLGHAPALLALELHRVMVPARGWGTSGWGGARGLRRGGTRAGARYECEGRRRRYDLQKLAPSRSGSALDMPCCEWIRHCFPVFVVPWHCRAPAGTGRRRAARRSARSSSFRSLSRCCSSSRASRAASLACSARSDGGQATNQ